MKERIASLSRDLKPIFGASDAIAPLAAAPEAVDPATGAATGFALAEIPILPVRESNNPPTDGDALMTISGSVTSPVMMSPIMWPTINALYLECIAILLISEAGGSNYARSKPTYIYHKQNLPQFTLSQAKPQLQRLLRVIEVMYKYMI